MDCLRSTRWVVVPALMSSPSKWHFSDIGYGFYHDIICRKNIHFLSNMLYNLLIIIDKYLTNMLIVCSILFVERTKSWFSPH